MKLTKHQQFVRFLKIKLENQLIYLDYNLYE